MVESLLGGLSVGRDFAALVQPCDCPIIVFSVQDGFCTRPLAHQKDDPASARPRLRGSFGPPFVRVARCVLSERPSTN